MLLKLHEQHVCSCSCGSRACGDVASESSQLRNIFYGRTIDSLRQLGWCAIIWWREVQVIGNLSCWGSQGRKDVKEEFQDERCGVLLSLSQLLEKPPLNHRLCSKIWTFCAPKSPAKDNNLDRFPICYPNSISKAYISTASSGIVCSKYTHPRRTFRCIDFTCANNYEIVNPHNQHQRSHPKWVAEVHKQNWQPQKSGECHQPCRGHRWSWSILQKAGSGSKFHEQNRHPQKSAANITSLVEDHHHRRFLLAEFHKRIWHPQKKDGKYHQPWRGHRCSRSMLQKGGLGSGAASPGHSNGGFLQDLLLETELLFETELAVRPEALPQQRLVTSHFTCFQRARANPLLEGAGDDDDDDFNDDDREMAAE